MTMFQNLGRMMGAATALKVECEACGHVVQWRRPRAIALLGAEASPYEIRRKLKCSKCGLRGRARVWV